MDLTRCPHCNKRMQAVTTADGRTGLQCLRCDEADSLKADAVDRTGAFQRAPTKAA